MISDLPKTIQQKVLEKLAVGQFQQAKRIHDQWLAKQAQQQARQPA